MRLPSYRPSVAADAVAASFGLVTAVQCTISDSNSCSMMHLRDNSSCQDPLCF